jgi:hypothetical protein
MYFEDSAGNQDSITFGYDQNAADSIGSDFNESNIIAVPRSSELEVRISNANNYEETEPTKESKVSISSDKCEDFWFPRWTISISSKNWPIKAKWDPSLFSEECIIGTVITGFRPGGWFDAGGCCSGLEYIYLEDSSFIVFNPSFDPEKEHSEGFINAQGDTISHLYFAFGDSKQLGVSINNLEVPSTIQIYPNPVENILNIEAKKNSVEWSIFSVNGYSISSGIGKQVETSGLTKGLYFLKIDNEIIKFIKR